jgi:hypothetical protein
MAYLGVWEANVWGKRDINDVGIRTDKLGRAVITKNNVEYVLHVDGDRISGSHDWFGTISGKQLVGARIELLKNGSPHYNITIARVRRDVVFPIGNPDPIETYAMVWHDPGTGASAGKALCNDVLPYNAETKYFQLFGMDPDEALIYRGDRYDTKAKTMNQKPEDDWFNIGCAGQTLAKMYLNRSTVYSQPQPNHEQRQSMLKMLVADYCGTRTGLGKTFTLTGEPIAWKGGLQTSYPSMAVLTTDEPPLDARWNSDGAVCMYNPRMQKSFLPDAAIFYDAHQQILDACPSLPDCENHDPEDLDGARYISANRVPLQ